MIDKTILYKSASIRYRLYGKGMPVVLLHGFGEDGSIWKNQIEFLKNFLITVKPQRQKNSKLWRNHSNEVPRPPKLLAMNTVIGTKKRL